MWAKELFFESISQINFISDHYIKGEYEEKYSMSSLNAHETNDEIMRLVRHLHSVGHKLNIHLNKADKKLFEQYLRDSQTGYDNAREGWGQWHSDDEMAETQHIANMIAQQGIIAAAIIEKLK